MKIHQDTHSKAGPARAGSTWARVTATALAGLGLILAGAPTLTCAQTAAVVTGDPQAPLGATVQDSVNHAMRQAELAIERAADVGRSVALRFTAGPGPRALVLPGTDMKAEEADRLTEDLGVMGRILEKAIGRGPSRGERLWFDGMIGGMSGRGPDALYLDGFGALFLLRVDYPLVAPASPRGDKEPEATDRTWEETRRELRQGTSGDVRLWEGIDGKPGRPDWAEFDAARVEELRNALIQAFKHASNLNLPKAEETVAVTVFGPAATDSESGVRAGGRRARGGTADEGKRTGSTLTLRARKADIDAFAKGKLSVEEFGKKVQETVR